MSEYVAYLLEKPKSCLSCPFSTKTGGTLECCIAINAHGNVCMGAKNLEEYKSCYCPLVDLPEDSGFLQSERAKSKAFNDFYAKQLSRFD